MTAERRRRLLVELLPVFLLVALFAVFAAVESRIADPANLRNVVLQATPIAVLALGAFVVLVSGGIDLSTGFSVALVAVVVGNALVADRPLVWAAGLGLLVAASIGLANGVLVGVLRLPAFIATLGTMTVVQGLTLFVATSGLLVIDDPVLNALGRRELAGIPVPVLLVVAIGGLMWVLMRQTRFGLRTYAIGSDAEKAVLSGVSPVRQQVLLYLLSGIFVWATALLLIGRIGLVQTNIGGVSLLLDAIAAAVIGGTSIFGGRGTVGGVLVGALIISLLTNALQVLGVDPSAINLYKGVIIIGALIADAVLRRVYTRTLRSAG
ncbi:ABC transporter permease [Asanoa sp. NPDC050611]|uniref:ABC transporter permease n=1 Tax=Asanoa sp. NPDC050611 TaxID=3157098 RepID=UPI0033C5AD24